MRRDQFERNEADIDRGKIRRLWETGRIEIADVGLFDGGYLPMSA